MWLSFFSLISFIREFGIKKKKWTNKNSPYVLTSIYKSSFWKTRICSQLALNQITHPSKQPTSLDNLKTSNFATFTVSKCFYRNAVNVCWMYFFLKFMKLFKRQVFQFMTERSIELSPYKPHIPLFSILTANNTFRHKWTRFSPTLGNF